MSENHLYWFNKLREKYPERKEWWIKEGYDEISEHVWNKTEVLIKAINELLKDRTVYFGYYVASVDIHIKDDKGDILINVDEDHFVASANDNKKITTKNLDEMIKFLEENV